jgi:cytochrome c
MRANLLFPALAACLALTACGDKPKPASSETPAAAGPTGLIDVSSLPHPYDKADLANGKAKFAMCSSCHTITEGGVNLTGPNLHGIFGRKAGSLPTYKYSDAVTAAGFTWDTDKLDHWLEKPREFLPGTKMTFAGFKDKDDRRDVIAYVAVESSRPKP